MGKSIIKIKNMIFDVKIRKDKKIEAIYKKSMKELDEFFQLNWK